MSAYINRGLPNSWFLRLGIATEDLWCYRNQQTRSALIPSTMIQQTVSMPDSKRDRRYWLHKIRVGEAGHGSGRLTLSETRPSPRGISFLSRRDSTRMCVCSAIFRPQTLLRRRVYSPSENTSESGLTDTSTHMGVCRACHPVAAGGTLLPSGTGRRVRALSLFRIRTVLVSARWRVSGAGLY